MVEGAAGSEIGGSRTKHAQNLCVFLTLLFEDEFALFAIILVLSTTPVLAALSLVLRHIGWLFGVLCAVSLLVGSAFPILS